MDVRQPADEKLISGYPLLAKFLTDAGFPISRYSLSTYCSRGIGPPKESYWGRLPTFKPSRSLEWARSRLRPVEAGRGRQAGEPTAA